MRTSIIIALVIAIGAAAWIMSGVIMGDPDSGTGDGETGATVDNGAQEEAAFRVRVAEFVAEPFQRDIVLRGHTEASREVGIAAEIDATVAQILVEEGAYVNAGDPLVQLSMADREARLAQADALIQQREIEYSAAAQLAQNGYSARTQLATARANLDAARAQRAAIAEEIADTTITAPFAGVVNSRPVEMGQYVRSGDVVAMLIDLQPVLMVGGVTEQDVSLVQVGAPAIGRLAGGQPIEGIIRYVSRTADPATRTFRVEIEVENPNASIADGMTAELHIPAEQSMAHLISPSVIALADDGAIGVRIVVDGNIVRFAEVDILADTPDGMWVAGLPERATIITVGQEFVGDGALVEPVFQDSGPIVPAQDGAAS